MISRDIRWAVSIATLILMLVVIILALSWCSERRRGKQAVTERDLAHGRTASAVEAIREIGALGERAGATDAQVEEAHNAIRQAAPADRDHVARYRLCILQQRTGCAGMLRTGPGDTDD